MAILSDEYKFIYFLSPGTGSSALSQFLLDNFIDDAHVHLESTADVDIANPYIHAFTGASYKWTRHSYDNINIDNPLLPGDASYHFSLSDSRLLIDEIRGRIELIPFEKGSRLSAMTTTFGGLGGRVGFTDWFINNISGHRSAGERQIFQIEQRPFTPWNLSYRYQNKFQKDTIPYPFKLEINTGSRQHVDQDYNGINTVYNENYFVF